MKSKRVLLDRNIAPIVQEQFHAAKLETDIVTMKRGMLESLVKNGDYAALLLRCRTPIPANILDAAGKGLKVIGIVGDSLDNINVTAASRRGILIKVTDYINAYEAANLSLRLMVMLLSQSFRNRDAEKAFIISDTQDFLARDLSGFELAGNTLGLIGCGKVAQSLAMQIQPYCKRIIGYDNHPRSVFENFHRHTPLERSVIEYDQLSELLEYSNIISIHTAGADKVFKGNELYFAKKRPFIINTSRTGHIDEAALLAALQEKRVSGAAMTLPLTQIKKADFADWVKPFLKMKNVIIAPSSGSPAPEMKKKSVRRLAQSVIDFLTTKDLSLAVNPMDVFPGCRKMQYPITRKSRRGAIPLLLGQ